MQTQTPGTSTLSERVARQPPTVVKEDLTRIISANRPISRKKREFQDCPTTPPNMSVVKGLETTDEVLKHYPEVFQR